MPINPGTIMLLKQIWDLLDEMGADEWAKEKFLELLRKRGEGEEELANQLATLAAQLKGAEAILGARPTVSTPKPTPPPAPEPEIPVPPVPVPDPDDPWQDVYFRILTGAEYNLIRASLKPGDRVFQRGEEYYVMAKGIGAQAPEGFVLLGSV